MIFYFLTVIVFIAELIIASFLLVNILKFDRRIKEWDEFLHTSKPEIKDILVLVRKISEQGLEFAPVIVLKVKKCISDLIISQLKSVLAGLVFYAVKKETEKHFG